MNVSTLCQMAADPLPKITLCHDALWEAGGRLNKSPHESNFVCAAAAAVIAVLGAPPSRAT